jgi:hypothetical protein
MPPSDRNNRSTCNNNVDIPVFLIPAYVCSQKLTDFALFPVSTNGTDLRLWFSECWGFFRRHGCLQRHYEVLNIYPKRVSYMSGGWVARVVGAVQAAYTQSVAKFPNMKPGADRPAS